MILPHKKSLKGTSYAKQVARRRSEVRGVTEFQMREQRASLPAAPGSAGREGCRSDGGVLSPRCPREGKSGSCDKAEQQTTCDNVAMPLLGCGQVTHDVEDECLSEAPATSG